MDKKKDTKKKLTKEDLKHKEWKDFNKGQQEGRYSSNENIMYQGDVKGKKWGW
ncbi:hypothetical protein HYG86_15280 [Alkalicella caledoniensis]|uniref:Uncharacterized protein n=1 Tax=Alkalicella caledoniensis TaxID=2731377 RepID=A0A7G9WBG9_ALKCA|nr:hypothetical protein [Alkalicella caledoniensis]QNO16031.1 hypothetical protein HYG86_15280 [Alkalicella caledoniensis]